jgi:hypothetical protein
MVVQKTNTTILIPGSAPRNVNIPESRATKAPADSAPDANAALLDQRVRMIAVLAAATAKSRCSPEFIEFFTTIGFLSKFIPPQLAAS